MRRMLGNNCCEIEFIYSSCPTPGLASLSSANDDSPIYSSSACILHETEGESFDDLHLTNADFHSVLLIAASFLGGF